MIPLDDLCAINSKKKRMKIKILYISQICEVSERDSSNSLKQNLSKFWFGQANFFACLTECQERVFNFRKDCYNLKVITHKPFSSPDG